MGGLLPRLHFRPHEVVIVLDAPSFSTTRALAHACGAELLRSPQIVCPQADLSQYFPMVDDRGSTFQLFF